MASTPVENAPPYTSFTTLMNTIERMSTEGGVPSRVDRSYLSNMPGSVRATFITSLKAFDLIGEDLRPTDKLIQLVQADDVGRTSLVSDLVHKRYPEALRLGKMATQSQMEEVFRSYGVTGSTVRKAIGFFLAAARYSGIELSPHFKLPKRNGAGAARPRPVKKAVARQGSNKPESPPMLKNPSAGLEDFDPFIVGLVRSLPAPGTVFEQGKQDAWFDTAKGIFKLIYKTGSDSTEARRPVPPTEGGSGA